MDRSEACGFRIITIHTGLVDISNPHTGAPDILKYS